MFYGEFTVTLDDKNRVVVPSKFREAIEQTDQPLEFFLAPGVDTCLLLFDKRSFEKLRATFSERDHFKANARTFQRLFFTRTAQVSCDSLGRILIPDKLKSHANISRDLTFAGVGERIEIWDSETWNRFIDENKSNFEQAARDLF